jgi:hypothetical protein
VSERAVAFAAAVVVVGSALVTLDVVGDATAGAWPPFGDGVVADVVPAPSAMALTTATMPTPLAAPTARRVRRAGCGRRRRGCLGLVCSVPCGVFMSGPI